MRSRKYARTCHSVITTLIYLQFNSFHRTMFRSHRALGNLERQTERRKLQTTRSANDYHSRQVSSPSRRKSLCPIPAQRRAREFYEISEKIRIIRTTLETFRASEHNPSELERIEGALNQLAKNFRLEIQLLAKSETVEHSK